MRNEILAALLMVNTLCTSYAGLELNIDESQNKVGFVTGDFIIGALFSIRHNAEFSFGQPMRCGKIRDQYGMQRVEAALWTINNINSEKKILPNNYTLGIHIRDTCWNSRFALRQSLQFIDFCPSKSNKIDATSGGSLIGVIGPPSSEETSSVQHLLQIFGKPQVGFSATSERFSKKENFEFFARVVPSDKYQALAMIQILQKFNWTYVNVVASKDLYGHSGRISFRDHAKLYGICIHMKEEVQIDATDSEFDKILSTFRKSNASKVIICFCQGETVRDLLRAAQRANESHKYILIGSDGWAGRDDIVKGIEVEAEGNLMIRINSSSVPNFKDYYLNMSQRANKDSGNPWIEDFYKEKFNCSFTGSEGENLCTGNEWNHSDYTEDPKLSFIVKSIYVFAYALSNFSREVCVKNKSASCMDLVSEDGKLFMDHYVRKVEFPYEDEIVRFNEDGDQVARYDIINYQYFNGSYQYRKVGYWFNDTLNLEVENIRLPGNVSLIRSVCSDPCRPGQRKEIPNTSQQCCWNCTDCQRTEYSDGVICSQCENGYMPFENKTGCVRKVTEPTLWWKTEILICVSISTTGISISLSSAAVFYKFRKTPVVKFSFKELSYIMYSGMILAYCSTYLILATATELTCTLVRFIPGLSLTMIYGPLLVKTNRVSRIFSMSKKRFPKLRPKYLSTKFQIMACIAFICMELAICAIHLKYHEPCVKEVVHETKITLQCDPYEVTSAHLLNIILLAFCTLYAFKIRHLPDNFNEAKFIAFSCYATVITWSAFLLIYHESSVKEVSLSLVLTTSSLIIQMCLFVPKLYIILLRPEKNQRANFVTARGMRVHVGSIDSTLASEHFIRHKNNGADSNASTEAKNSNKISRTSSSK